MFVIPDGACQIATTLHQFHWHLFSIGRGTWFYKRGKRGSYLVLAIAPFWSRIELRPKIMSWRSQWNLGYTFLMMAVEKVICPHISPLKIEGEARDIDHRITKQQYTTLFAFNGPWVVERPVIWHAKKPFSQALRLWQYQPNSISANSELTCFGLVQCPWFQWSHW